MSHTMEIIDLGLEFGVQAYASAGYYLHRDTDLMNGTWMVRRGLGSVLIGGVNWCEAKDEFWRNTGEDLGNAWGDCAERKAIVAIPEFVSEPTQHETSGKHFASFAESAITGAVAGGVTAALYEHSKETKPMCETRQQAIETNCDCAWHDRQIEQTVDPAVQFMARATGALAVLALAGALIALTGGLIAVFAAVTGVLYAVYKLRHVALTILLAALSVVVFPLRFFGSMVADGVAEIKQEQAQATPKPMTISNSYRVVEPLLLSDNLQPDTIEFNSAEPVFVNIPGRATRKKEAKQYGNQ